MLEKPSVAAVSPQELSRQLSGTQIGFESATLLRTYILVLETLLSFDSFKFKFFNIGKCRISNSSRSMVHNDMPFVFIDVAECGF